MKAIILVSGLLWCIPAHAQIFDSIWVGTAGQRLGALYNTGDFKQCKDLNIRLLDTARTRYGASSREAAEMLFSLAEIQKITEDFGAAEQSYNAYLDLARQLYGARDVRTAEALNQLGFIHFRQENYDRAEKLYLDSRQMFVELGMSPSLQMSSLASDLASVYEARGMLLKAEEEHLEALRIARGAPDMAPRTFGILLNNIAVFYADMQRHDLAVRYMDDYLGLLEKNIKKTHPAYLKARANKGGMLTDAGSYTEARALLEQTLQTARQVFPAGDPQLAFFLRKTATFYHRNGHFEDAIRLRQEALQLISNRYGETHTDYSTALRELAASLVRTPHLQEADSALRKAIRLMEQTGRKGSLSYAQALISLAITYQQNGRPDLARPLVLQGAELGATLLGTDNPGFYLSFGTVLIDQYLLEGQPDSALLLLDAARQLVRNTYGPEHQINIKVAAQTGKAWQLKGDAARALEYFSETRDILRYYMHDIFRYLSIEEREKFARAYEGFRTAFLATARSFPDHAGVSAFLFDLTLFQKELLASYDRQLLAGWQKNSDSTYQTYIGIRCMIARQYTLPVNQRLDLPELEARRASLEKTLTVGLASEPVKQVRWQDIQQALLPGDAVIEWLSLPAARDGAGRSRYAALLLRPGFPAPELVLLNEADQADALFSSRGSRGLQYASRTYSGTALYQAFWKPLESRLTGVQRVFYAPNGPLHLLNFDAILTPEGQLLAEKYRLVRVTNSVRLLEAGFGNSLTGIGSALLAGGLNYESVEKAPPGGDGQLTSRGQSWRGGGGVVREWPALPNTGPEVEYLSALLRREKTSVALLTGIAGSETAIKAQCRKGPDLLHFATHGFFFEKNSTSPTSLGLVTAENPMFRSGLILSGANPAWRGEPAGDHADDGILTADEITLLPLRHTALVVLSACETGLGDVHDDEGVYGLQRAFRLAGARNLVMSLWRVPDLQTREFMEIFYHALLEKGEVRQAMHQARQTMRGKYANPYYWAGFVLLE